MSEYQENRIFTCQAKGGLAGQKSWKPKPRGALGKSAYWCHRAVYHFLAEAQKWKWYFSEHGILCLIHVRSYSTTHSVTLCNGNKNLNFRNYVSRLNMTLKRKGQSWGASVKWNARPNTPLSEFTEMLLLYQLNSFFFSRPTECYSKLPSLWPQTCLEATGRHKNIRKRMGVQAAI